MATTSTISTLAAPGVEAVTPPVPSQAYVIFGRVEMAGVVSLLNWTLATLTEVNGTSRSGYVIESRSVNWQAVREAW